MIVLLLTILQIFLFSQTPENDVQKLPGLEIYGNDVLNVKGGEKKSPNRIPTLSPTDLDSINGLDKQQSLLLPAAELPKYHNPKLGNLAYLRSSIGRFTTLSNEVGYFHQINDFDLFLKGNLDYSNGHLKNADYFDININILSDYIADKKYWIFGGSKTRTQFNYSKANYNLFPSETILNRNADSITLVMDVDGYYGGFEFQTGLGLDFMFLNFQENDFNDRSLNGYLKIINPLNKYKLGINTYIDIRNGNNQANNFFEATALFNYQSNNFDVKLDGGFQLGENELESIFQPKILAKLNFKPNHLFTIQSSFRMGVIRNTLSNLFRSNYYLNDSIFLDQTVEKLGVDISFEYHKIKDFTLEFGVDYSIKNNDLNWVSDDDFEFEPLWLNSQKINIYSEVFYNLLDNHKFSLILNYYYSKNDSTNKFLTYLPNFIVGVNYFTNLFENLSINFGIDYNGNRFADIENLKKLDAFVNSNLKINYKVNNTFSVFLAGDNLLNQDVFLFENYLQRKMFLSLGILWKF